MADRREATARAGSPATREQRGSRSPEWSVAGDAEGGSGARGGPTDGWW